MTRYFMVGVLTLVFGASVWAGGPPPVYVVVDKVVLEPNVDAPETIRIEGCFVRTGNDERYKYEKPVEGYVYISIEPGKEKLCREEWAKWQKAAGTGKAVAVGSCGDGGCFMNVRIHKLDEKTPKPDAAYTTDLLGRIGGVYAEGSLAREKPVIDLLAFAKAREGNKNERK